MNCKCSHCTKWVECKTKGFCLVKDLFTYTELEEDAVCPDFVEGEPQTEEEYESAQLFQWNTSHYYTPILERLFLIG